MTICCLFKLVYKFNFSLLKTINMLFHYLNIISHDYGHKIKTVISNDTKKDKVKYKSVYLIWNSRVFFCAEDNSILN